jgi:hypothetical protein
MGGTSKKSTRRVVALADQHVFVDDTYVFVAAGDIHEPDAAVVKLNPRLFAPQSRIAVFVEVSGRGIAPVQVVVARATLDRCADLLAIECPTLRWFDMETDAERAYIEAYRWRDWDTFCGDDSLMGIYVEGADELWIRAGLDAIETMGSVAHEMRHAAQVETTMPADEREADAEAFARAFVDARGIC